MISENSSNQQVGRLVRDAWQIYHAEGIEKLTYLTIAANRLEVVLFLKAFNSLAELLLQSRLLHGSLGNYLSGPCLAKLRPLALLAHRLLSKAWARLNTEVRIEQPLELREAHWLVLGDILVLFEVPLFEE